MGSNNWLSFPLSPTHHPSLPPHLQPNQSHHHFSLGTLVNDNMLQNPFQNHDWNLMNSSHNSNEVPKVADFLGVSSKSTENESDLAAYNEMNSSNHHSLDNYLFMPPVQNSSATSSNNYDQYEENPNNNLQSLTLSMGSGTTKDSTCDNNIVEAAATPRRALDTFGQRTSIYRGVTRHRWTGRFEAHLWDKTSWNKIQNKKGKQVYLGAYDTEEAAARTYDLAALKYWGKDATLNFPIETYAKEFEEMDKASKEEYLNSLRRQSSGFSRGLSKYRGVARHHHNGRWEARIGRVRGNKYLYLGTYKTQEEAAVAYDMAAIKHRGINAVTNFDISNYMDKLKVEKNDEKEQTEPQSNTEIVANSPDSEEALEEQTTTTPPQEENQLQIEPLPQQFHQQHVPPTSHECAIVNIMDHCFDQDYPWSFMYNGLSEFQDTGSTMSKCGDDDLMNIFDGSSFDDNIEFELMFNTEEPCGGRGESDINISEVLEGIDLCGGLLNGDAGDMVVDEDSNKEKDLLSLDSSSSSPSSSTTTISL